MSNPVSSPRYSSVSVFIHWVTVTCIFSAFTLVWATEYFDLEDYEKTIIFTHKSLGISVMVLTLLRLAIKLSGRAGDPVEKTDRLHRLATGLGHLGLYGFMLGTPLVGWLKSSAAGKAISLFGIPLPALMAKNRDLADTLGDLHETIAYAFLGLIALHVVAALWHSVIRKDGVMYSMLPVKRLLPEL